jgi:putative mycofactocin binding protein MftB
MVAVVRSLDSHDSVRAALAAAGVPDAHHDRYRDALASLAASDMIVPQTVNGEL